MGVQGRVFTSQTGRARGKPASPAMAPDLEGHLLLKSAMAHRMGSRSQGTLPTNIGSFSHVEGLSPVGRRAPFQGQEETAFSPQRTQSPYPAGG